MIEIFDAESRWFQLYHKVDINIVLHCMYNLCAKGLIQLFLDCHMRTLANL